MRLSREELLAVWENAGEEEKALLRELAKSDDPLQAHVLAELLHFFPGSSLVDKQKDQDGV